MKKPTLRTGIVGAGFSARFHFEAVQRVVCADVDVARCLDTHVAAQHVVREDVLAALGVAAQRLGSRASGQEALKQQAASLCWLLLASR